MSAPDRSAASGRDRPGFWSYVVVLLAFTPLILHLSGLALR